ncbi:DNA primase, partial [bacterium]|nr:DNA primase [bacterium]
MIPEQTIAEILERVDLVKLVGRQVKLRKAGAGFMGLCPFHDEKSPSFSVSPVRRTYHCFGCGAHGDAVRFLMEQHGRSFPEAVRELAAEVGVMVPEERPEPPARRAERERQRSEAERLFAAQDAVTTYYTDTLFSPAGEPAQRYLTGRGFTPDTARAFRLGYADGDAARFQRFLATTDVALADLVALGLLLVPDTGPDPSAPLQGHYLRFRRRLMCPVVDVRGQVTGYSGRVLDAKAKAAKYVNSPETPVFTKGDQLYGAFTARSTARRAGRVILCEGNLDVVALWQAGFPGTVAAMGTALTTRQVRLVKRLSEQVICVMDGDAAGAKAAFASLLPFLEEGIQPRAVLLTGGHDPDSYVREHGADAFRTLLAAARPLLDLYIEREAAARPADALGRAEGLRALAPALRLLQDPLTRDLYRQQVASTLGVPLDFVDRAIQEAAPAPAP